MTMRPEPNEYAEPYADYVALVHEDDIVSAIETQSSEMQKVMASVDDARGAYRYADGKWSVKEVFGHITDAERVFGYRAMCIARGDQSSLPGFDEQEYMRHANFDDWKIGDLAEQYALNRRANIVFFRNLPEVAWKRRGIANDSAVTVLALAFIIAGHERHHLKVLRERYGL